MMLSIEEMGGHTFVESITMNKVNQLIGLLIPL